MKFETIHGQIAISNDALTDLAGIAATGCFGVKGMAASSTKDGLVHLLKRESLSKGVKLSYHEDGSISVELHIIVDNGVNLTTTCSNIMKQVRYKLSDATGIQVKAVDVYVDSMQLG